MRDLQFFTLSEFACKCCGQVRMDDSFLIRLDLARKVANTPFQIVSGYRCHSHNAAVGSKPTSSHVLGLAADIMAADSPTRWRVVWSLIEAGFTRIGVGHSFVHVDSDGGKPSNVLWVY